MTSSEEALCSSVREAVAAVRHWKVATARYLGDAQGCTEESAMEQAQICEEMIPLAKDVKCLLSSAQDLEAEIDKANKVHDS